jgi:hypothetical protein
MVIKKASEGLSVSRADERAAENALDEEGGQGKNKVSGKEIRVAWCHRKA